MAKQKSQTLSPGRGKGEGVHQFALFGFADLKPKLKVPISAARIREVKALIARRDGANAALALRDVREGLERFEKRIHG